MWVLCIRRARPLQASDGRRRDHAAIGNDTHAMDGENPPQAVDDMQKRRDVHRTAATAHARIRQGLAHL